MTAASKALGIDPQRLGIAGKRTCRARYCVLAGRTDFVASFHFARAVFRFAVILEGIAPREAAGNAPVANTAEAGKLIRVVRAPRGRGRRRPDARFNAPDRGVMVSNLHAMLARGGHAPTHAAFGALTAHTGMDGERRLRTCQRRTDNAIRTGAASATA